MPSPDPNLGRVLDNRYELLELIGKGAMGRVYMARHILLEGHVAVKFLAQTLLSDKMRERFFREARICAQLGQKTLHIVRVTDFGVDDSDVPFYVMELLEGDSLSEVLHDQPLPVPRFLNITRQLCLGLKCAHEGIMVENHRRTIIHRDIKPSNILILPRDGGGELAKILDFGISQIMESDSHATKTFMGTLAYASPEQMDGKEIDSRSDIYSMGIMMYQMLTGKLPLQPEHASFGNWYKVHHSGDPLPFNAAAPKLQIPPALQTLVYGCMAKNPAERPQNAQAILDAIRPLEDRFGGSRDLGLRIRETLARVPVGDSQHGESTATPDEICRLQSWPRDKPIARIVFPEVLVTSRSRLVTLWVMLPQEEIDYMRKGRAYNRVYRNFLCTPTPHPTVMWLTAVYNKVYHSEGGPRWLYAYIDLKAKQGVDVLQALSTQGEYRVLMFAMEAPQKCAHVLTTRVNEMQCNLMKQWLLSSRTQVVTGGSFNLSKDILRREFEKLKPQIRQKLTSESPTSSTS
ncbi:MAG: serine/threonine-protein kinase [Cyanobacteria bacterium P01_H01_bin.121]